MQQKMKVKLVAAAVLATLTSGVCAQSQELLAPPVEVKGPQFCGGEGGLDCTWGVKFVPAEKGSESTWLMSGAEDELLGIGTEDYWSPITGQGTLVSVAELETIHASQIDLEGGLDVYGKLNLYAHGFEELHHIDSVLSNGEFSLRSGYLSVDEVVWTDDGRLSVNSDASEASRQAILAVGSFVRDAGDTTVVLNVSVKQNSVLVLGQAAYEKFAEQGQPGVVSLRSLLGTVEMGWQDSRATLVSAPTITGLSKGLVVAVGTQVETPDNAKDNVTIVVGDQGRWLVDLSLKDGAGVSREASGAAATVKATSGAQLCLTGWNGKSGTLIEGLDPSWQGVTATLVSSRFFGDVSVSDTGSLMIEHRAWSTIEGLSAKAIVDEAEAFYLEQAAKSSEETMLLASDVEEEASENGTALADIGRQYIEHVIFNGSASSASSVLSREIDSTVFLAGYSGLLASVDSAQRRTHETLLTHDAGMETEADFYWWASVYMGYGSQDRLNSGDSWSSTEDFYGGTLGVDYRFTPNWIGTLAVSGATADIDSKGINVDATASTTMASVGGAVQYAINDRHLLFAAATYSQTQGEAKKIAVDYRIRTEPEFRQLTADIGWKAHYAMESAMHIRPTFSIGWEQGRMRKGDVALSDQLGTNSGIGFEQSVDNRQVWHARGHLDVSGRFTVFGYNVEPGLNAGLTVYAGDTDWTVSSKLAEGSAVSKKSFHSGGHWHATGGLSLTISDRGREPIMEGGIFGFGAKNSGKTRPYDWCMTVFGSAEAGAYGSRAASFGVRYREIF